MATGVQRADERVPAHLPATMPPVLDGSRPLEVEALIDLARDRLDLGARWLSWIVGPEGRMPYNYYPRQDAYDWDDYNEVRHAGTTYSLFQACGLLRDPEIVRAAERAAGWIETSSVPAEPGGQVFAYRDKMKLGGQALAILALLERRRALEDTAYDWLIADLTTFLEAMELPEEPGRYHQSYRVSTRKRSLTPASDYYPGEALLAVTRLAQHFPDGPFLDVAKRAASYLIYTKDGDIPAAGAVPRHDHWLAMALSDLYLLHPDPAYSRVAYLQAEAMIASQYPPDHPNWRHAGASRRGNSVNYTSTATKAEAMIAVWNLARYIGDDEAAGRFAEASLRTIQFQMRVQYTEEIARNFPNPDRLVGAWAQDERDQRIRIDFVQHNISALAGAWQMIREGRLPLAGPAGGDWHDRPAPLPVAEYRRFQGPNAWSVRPVVHAVLDARPLEGRNVAQMDALAERLGQLLGTFPGDQGSARRPEHIGEVLASLMLGLQKLGGWKIERAGARPRAGEPGVFDVYCEYEDAIAGEAVASLATQALNDLIHGRTHSPSFITAFERDVVRPSLPADPGDRERLIAEARRRGIPVSHPDGAPDMLEFGSGRYLRRFWQLTTSETPRIGVKIAGNKALASEILRRHGLPVAANARVRTVAEAVAAAERIGYPVVLKPLDANHAKGVVPGIRDAAGVRRHFEWAKLHARRGDVIVERYLEGISYRILVIGYQVFAVLERLVAQVTGDGVHTVEELIEALNAEPERQDRPGNYLSKVTIDEQTLNALAQQNMTLTSIPAAGEVVRVKLIPSGANGGTREDCTERIHPDNAAIAIRASRALGIDLCGLDFATPDISQSVWETGGGIVEINSSPGLYPHYRPTGGVVKDPTPAILEMLYPLGSPVRALVVALAGGPEIENAAALIAQMLAAQGHMVATSPRDGTLIGAMQTRSLDAAAPRPDWTLLRNPDIDAAVLTLTQESLDFPGLPVEEVDVAVIASAPESSGEGVMPIEELIVRLVAPKGQIVLDASAAGWERLAKLSRGDVMLVSVDGASEAVRAHVASGGRAVVAATERERVTLRLLGPDGAQDIASMPSGSSEREMRPALLAAAAGVARGVTVDTVRQALQAQLDTEKGAGKQRRKAQ
jgi:cyanophycin synthetase